MWGHANPKTWREESGGARGGGGERGRERARAGMQERRSRESALAPPLICFFPPPGPALCKFGLARSAVCSTWSLHSGPRTFFCSILAGFSRPCLVATVILDSFSLFYLPNNYKKVGLDLEWWTLKSLARHSSRVLDKLCYSSQANQCYSSILFRR